MDQAELLAELRTSLAQARFIAYRVGDKAPSIAGVVDACLAELMAYVAGETDELNAKKSPAGAGPAGRRV